MQPPSPPDLSLHPLRLRGRAHHIEIEEMVVYLDFAASTREVYTQRLWSKTGDTHSQAECVIKMHWELAMQGLATCCRFCLSLVSFATTNTVQKELAIAI